MTFQRFNDLVQSCGLKVTVLFSKRPESIQLLTGLGDFVDQTQIVGNDADLGSESQNLYLCDVDPWELELSHETAMASTVWPKRAKLGEEPLMFSTTNSSFHLRF
jgi:hypothetical protein